MTQQCSQSHVTFGRSFPYSLFSYTVSAFCNFALLSYLCSEFIGEDGEDKFWRFVDTVKEITVYKNGGEV